MKYTIYSLEKKNFKERYRQERSDTFAVFTLYFCI